MSSRATRHAVVWTFTTVFVLLCAVSSGSATPGIDDPTPPPGYQLLETVTVPVNGSSIVSQTTLQAGVGYKIRATGTFTIGGPGSGDAEYAFNANHSFVQNACADTSPDLGIGINDTVNDASKSPFWGALDASHVYTIDFTGAGTPIGLNYHDCAYGDNVGSLKVRIFAPAGPAPHPPEQTFGTDEDGTGMHAHGGSGLFADP